MPEGLENTISKEEMAHLIAFLTDWKSHRVRSNLPWLGNSARRRRTLKLSLAETHWVYL